MLLWQLGSITLMCSQGWQADSYSMTDLPGHAPHLAGPEQPPPQGPFCGGLPTPPVSWPDHPPRHPPASPGPRACPPFPCSPVQRHSGLAALRVQP